MKKFNQILFLLGFVVIADLSGMEQMVPARQGKWFIELDDKDVQYHIGGNIRYYKEYHASNSNNKVLFPVKSTDPLPIEYFGEKRFFMLSADKGSLAIRGGFGGIGEPYMILDPAIKQLAVVRGVSQSNNCGVNVYMGLDTDNVKRCGHENRDRLYTARILILQAKEKNCSSDSGNSWYHNHSMPNEIRCFNNLDICLEVKKHLSPSDFGWRNPVMQAKVKELFGKRAQNFNFENQSFYSNEVYWTEKENKLKGITYHSDRK